MVFLGAFGGAMVLCGAWVRRWLIWGKTGCGGCGGRPQKRAPGAAGASRLEVEGGTHPPALGVGGGTVALLTRHLLLQEQPQHDGPSARVVMLGHGGLLQVYPASGMPLGMG